MTAVATTVLLKIERGTSRTSLLIIVRNAPRCC